MLQESNCEHLPGLGPLAGSSNASLPHDIPTEVQRLASRLVRMWWSGHGLPEVLRCLKKENEHVSFVSRASWRGQGFASFTNC
jgi:hypothetical protein